MNLFESLHAQPCSIKGLRESLRQRHIQTHEHCERVVLLADAFGRACALSPDEQVQLLYSAMFHDIGKIGIPDSILLHPDALGPEQRKTMQQHSTMGEAIVRLMQLPQGDRIADYVRYHHEHFDGSGYPDGLAGEAIPRIARMLSILDSYDALRETRPYRAAMQHNDAIEIMQSENGTKHDPALLTIFLQLDAMDIVEKQYGENEK
ncbi:HD domain-containing protein [Sulfurimonas sp. HSL-3221]|uniref:HD-GYP domain-containing protein n=1 Tax=Sulfurimonadaceae TaxID=2771471 RepID=UPI001E2BDB60|nr:HD domain-containing phosphohydrolase [Sulfurimonas sp. HSL-3221]UFS62071.1 HD domain-containing protein [Sulfurimonas sp. HSL-3221]